jgi:hypothetical protein
MRSRWLIAASLVFAGCTGEEAAMETQPAQTGPLHYEAPASWQHQDSTEGGTTTTQWVPADNDRKESISVIRTPFDPALAKAGVDTIEQLLVSAQPTDPQVSALPVRVATKRALAGVRVEVDYVPPGQHDSYHRVHAVLLDGNALVHVLYTARNPDPQRSALQLVIDTLHHEES